MKNSSLLDNVRKQTIQPHSINEMLFFWLDKKVTNIETSEKYIKDFYSS